MAALHVHDCNRWKRRRRTGPAHQNSQWLYREDRTTFLVFSVRERMLRVVSPSTWTLTRCSRSPSLENLKPVAVPGFAVEPGMLMVAAALPFPWIRIKP